MRLILLSLAISILAGCAGLVPADRNLDSMFTYDYSVPGRTQTEIWKSARDYFAGTFGDSRAVWRVMDEMDGTLIGQGIAGWDLLGHYCLSNYHIRFAAKDNKARLQFEIIDGVPAGSPCVAWPWPSQNGYDSMAADFIKTSKAVHEVLSGSTKSLKDF